MAMNTGEMRALDWARSAAAARGLQNIDIEQGGDELALELALSGDRGGRRVGAFQEAARSLLDADLVEFARADYGQAEEGHARALSGFFGDPHGERSVRMKPLSAAVNIPALTEDRRKRIEADLRRGKALSTSRGKEEERERLAIQRYRAANARLRRTTEGDTWRDKLDELKESGYPWGIYESDSAMLKQGLGKKSTYGDHDFMNRSDESGGPPHWVEID